MIKAIIFDKDGTLFALGNMWDKPTEWAYRKLLKQSQLNPDQQEAFMLHMGIDQGKMVPNSLSAAGSIQDQAEEFNKILPLSTKEISQMLEDNFLTYISQHPEAFVLMPGLEATLETLAKDYYLGLVTNDNYRLAQQALETTGLAKYFRFVGCADQYAPKPNPAALEALAQKEGFAFDEMVYVGDSALDMTYGRLTKAAIGFAEQESYRTFLKEADYLIDHMEQLPALIDQINREQD
ncbi:HAD family hydrolase [Vaginisenegalia massiliensis]|uniref:HAD family hydrolase n=1 Tax=Vaginisenegalia massiliensis TaxID=2058294 RepID=UPI0013DE0F15|nr:HAD family hydrolase [Vaginisenegalia massiliensis]